MADDQINVGELVRLVGIFTFNRTRGRISAGSTQLTVENASGYATADTVVVAGAGDEGDELITTVSSVAGSIITLAATANRSVSDARVGKAISPTTVVCKVKKPDLVVTTYSGAQVILDGVGQYHVDVSIDQAGTWWFHFSGTGTGQAAGERDFWVRSPVVS